MSVSLLLRELLLLRRTCGKVIGELHVRNSWPPDGTAHILARARPVLDVLMLVVNEVSVTL